MEIYYNRKRSSVEVYPDPNRKSGKFFDFNRNKVGFTTKFIADPDSKVIEFADLHSYFQSKILKHFTELVEVTGDPSYKSTVAEMRQGFSNARRRALQTQGAVTMERVKENQLTMKFPPEEEDDFSGYEIS